MLKPKVLTEVLSRLNTNGITGTLLINSEGSLLAYAGDMDKNPAMVAALINNIWELYEKLVESLLSDKLNGVTVNCLNGMVYVTKVESLLLCIYAKEFININMGMVEIKVKALKEYLSPYLQKIIL